MWNILTSFLMIWSHSPISRSNRSTFDVNSSTWRFASSSNYRTERERKTGEMLLTRCWRSRKSLMMNMDLLLNIDFNHSTDLFFHNEIWLIENRKFSPRRNFINWTNEMMIVLWLHSMFFVFLWQYWPKRNVVFTDYH